MGKAEWIILGWCVCTVLWFALTLYVRRGILNRKIDSKKTIKNVRWP